MVRDVLRDGDGGAGSRVGRDQQFAAVTVEVDLGANRALGLDDVVDADPERHPALGRAIADHHSVSVVLDELGLEDAVRELFGEARVHPLLHSLDQGLVLAVEELGGDGHRRVVVE